MDIGAIPKQLNIIEKELNELRELQNQNGTFRNFGLFPPRVNYDKGGEYFETAYIVHAFLKASKIIRKKYNDVISKSFVFLNSNSSMLKSTKDGLSMAAYAFALNGRKDKATALLNQVEQEAYVNGSMKCFKITRSSDCDITHTCYAMMAYVKIGEADKALPIFNWLTQNHNKEKYSSNTYTYAIATEAIAEIAKLGTISTTDFTVTLRNEADFFKTIHITEKNIKDVYEEEFPEYSKQFNITASGVGFCSITTIIEKSVMINVTKTKFDLKVAPLNENTVQVCATYNPGEETSASVLNVIYDVEFPSGYIFLKIIDLETKREIQVIQL